MTTETAALNDLSLACGPEHQERIENHSTHWTEVDLDVVDALARILSKKELAVSRLVCAAWRNSIDSCIHQLRPQAFRPKELAASFKAINRLDLHALDDVTDKQLQDLAAAQHVPHEDDLLAQALRKLHGGSICSRSECPSVTGTLSRADSFDMDDSMSDAASSTPNSLAKQLTPLRKALALPQRAAASLHSSKPSLDSPLGSMNKAAASRLWPPPRAPTSIRAESTVLVNPSLPPSPLPEDPSSSQSPFTPSDPPSDSPRPQSFHSAASFSTLSHPSQRSGRRRARSRSGRHAKRLPHPKSQAQMRLAEETIGAPQPGTMILAHRPSSVQEAETEPALAWLTCLNISQCWRVTDTGISALAGLTTLEDLDMSCCTHVNRTGFAAVASLPHLSSLTVAKMRLSTGSLECVGTMTGLRCLSATLCSWDTTDQPLAAAVTRLSQLTDLRLANSQSLQDEELSVLLGSLTHLQRLDIAECYKLTERGMSLLQLPLHLTALNFNRTAVTDTALKDHVCKLLCLKQLSIMGCHQVSDSGIRHLTAAASELTMLDISSCREVTDEGLAELTQLSSLQTLVMNSMSPGVTGCFLSSLQGLQQLHGISCASCTGFMPAAVSAIGSMHGLLELNMKGPMSLGSLQSLTALKALTGVEALNLAKWPISGSQEVAVMHSIGHMWRLTQLDLAESLVSSKGLRELVGLQSLVRLSFKCCTNVNDQALKAVGQLTALTWLSLHYCKAISDKGLMHLAALSALVHLDIGFCEKLTDRGVAHLAHLPCLSYVRMAGCHRIKLYQESRETSGKVDIRQWAKYDQVPGQHKGWASAWKRMLCSCSSEQPE